MVDITDAGQEIVDAVTIGGVGRSDGWWGRYLPAVAASCWSRFASSGRWRANGPRRHPPWAGRCEPPCGAAGLWAPGTSDRVARRSHGRVHGSRGMRVRPDRPRTRSSIVFSNFHCGFRPSARRWVWRSRRWSCARSGRDASPSTADEYIKAFHDPEQRLDFGRCRPAARQRGDARRGAAMGFEGPSIYLGAAIGSWLQRRFSRASLAPTTRC